MANRLRYAVVALGLIGAAACTDFLDVEPVSELPREKAITGPTSARAAVLGIYDVLQDAGSYYGGDFVLLPDVSADDVTWTGTFTTYADAEDNLLRATNGSVEGIYNTIYQGISRANFVLAELPDVAGMPAAEKEELLGEAYFLRALMYHDLVKLFGGMNPTDLGVPLILAPTGAEAPPTMRATVAQVYTQIFADLDRAEAALSDDNLPSRASYSAARALRARVELFRGTTAGWTAAEALATEIISSGDFALAPSHADQFTEEGSPTSEDIFKLTHTAVDWANIGYYYLGRYEVAPDVGLLKLFDPDMTNDPRTYSPTEDRGLNDAAVDGGDPIGLKFPTTSGAEDFPIIRLAEMYLIRAEARARIGTNLLGAVADVNVIRRRAGADTLVFGVDVTTQPQVLAAVEREWRLEFAMEGHRWYVMRRFGTIAAWLQAQDSPSFQDRYPIPQSEINVVPGLQQNPGYAG